MQHLAENPTGQQDGAEDYSEAPNRPSFDSYIPFDVQDSGGRSYRYQFGQRAVGAGPSPIRIRPGGTTPRKAIPVITDLSAQLGDAQKVIEAQQDRLDATTRECEIHDQRTALIESELKNVQDESQRQKEGLHMKPGLAEYLWKNLSQQAEAKGLDKPKTAAGRLQDKITLLMECADMEAALRQEALERHDAAATVLPKKVAQLVEELKKQEATTASLYNHVTQLRLDLGAAEEERLQLMEELKRAATATENSRRQMSRGVKSTPSEAGMEVSQLQKKLQQQDAANISLHTQIAPLLEELEKQEATTARLYKQVAHLQLDHGGARGERLRLEEELNGAEVAMENFRQQISMLTALQSETKQALQREAAVANGIQDKFIQRKEQALQRQEELKRREELKRQDTATASLGKQIAQLEELEREEAITASLNKDIAELLEEFEASQAALEDLCGLVSQLETLQNASEEALNEEEAFANHLGQKIAQLDELDGAAEGAMRQRTEMEKQNADAAARQRQANQLASSLPGAMYGKKTLQERAAELTAQLANKGVDDRTHYVIVDMKVVPVEAGYLNSRAMKGSGQRVFNMDVHVL
ncbi:hypothetical protein B0I35DRAFT_481390 [Stachybotrys elegans]|uniref:Uncharacterized protein n=1 Tax=Stachybotrys elegans TaxID=80388 RepID=A0A8K0WPN7_9HYPO|nr:hypothetical protein B0I35DRAFT_481390 [Stachybotrys elegans]